MTPADLLDAARNVLADTSAATAGWPRMVALLTRQALEETLSKFWESRPATAGLSGCTRKSQFACLPFYLDARISRETAYAWGALSDACHYHAYELAPTVGELNTWIDAVAMLAHAIGQTVPVPSLAEGSNSSEGS